MPLNPDTEKSFQELEAERSARMQRVLGKQTERTEAGSLHESISTLAKQIYPTYPQKSSAEVINIKPGPPKP